MKKFEVEVELMARKVVNLEIEAETKEKAMDLAEQQACDDAWHEHSLDWETDGVWADEIEEDEDED